MKSYSYQQLAAGLLLSLTITTHGWSDVIAADDFLYNQPTKMLGPGGGFTLQDYGGGQISASGQWAGRWISSGNGIITGADFEEEDNRFLGLTAAGLSPVTANFLARDFQLNGLADTQPLYFAVRSRVDIDATVQPRFWLNAPVGDPLADEGQISIGFDDFGFVAELGLDFESNEDELANDGEDHLLVGKLEVNAAGDNERLTVWLDPTAAETGPSATVENDVVGSLADLRGTLQLGRLNDGSAIYWDDVAVGTSWDDVVQVDVPRVTLRVNRANGSASLVNETGESFSLNYYEILSGSDSLDLDGWSGLEDNNIAGWLKNNPNSGQITESNFTGASILASGQSLGLGRIYQPGTAEDFVARWGTSQGILNLADVEFVDAEPQRGDFNGNGLIDADDMDLLSAEVRAGTNDVAFDLNGDAQVNGADRDVWITAPDIANTYSGDSNLDGEFGSADLVLVFTAGEYEDAVPGNSTWATGDWDGNGDFQSGDIVAAFTAGGYELGPRPAAQAVPEPSAAWLMVCALCLVTCRRRFTIK